MRSFTNLDKAYEVVASSSDPIEKALLNMALNKVRVIAVQELEQTTSEAESKIQTTFDLLFYVQVVKALFEPEVRKRLQRILSGDKEAMQDFPDFN